jgi:hypothetical protein
MQEKMQAVEDQMKDMGSTIAAQTYQALVTHDSPLATKTDHAHLQHEIGVISSQLHTLIDMFKSGVSTGAHHLTPTPAAPTSPHRTSNKRLKHNLTPEKTNKFEDLLTQANSDSSAASALDEDSEGCED